jgi:hypothetical protein
VKEIRKNISPQRAQSTQRFLKKKERKASEVHNFSTLLLTLFVDSLRKKRKKAIGCDALRDGH